MNGTERFELLTVYDDNLNPIGERSREEVHTEGLLHQTVRLWIIQDDSIWFQLRSAGKSLFPKRLDASTTGHISAGESPEKAVLRETVEEIGLSLTSGDIHKLGRIPFPFVRPDGKLDNEFANIFLYKATDRPCFKLSSEVDDMVSMTMQDYIKMVKTKTPVRAITYRCHSDGETPPTRIGYATYGEHDFCCLNAEELSLIQSAVAMPTHIFG